MTQYTSKRARNLAIFTFLHTGAISEWNFFNKQTSGAFTASTNAVHVPSAGTTQEVDPLTSSPPSRGQSWGEPCGELSMPLEMVKPV
jgi:hypothetical protein